MFSLRWDIFLKSCWESKSFNVIHNMNIFVDKVTIDGAHLVSFHFINCDIGQ